MPNKRVASPVTLTYQFDIVTSNTANVTAMITPTGLATAKMVNEHRTAAELDHPEKSVKRKHLADNVYTLPAPEATNVARFVGGDHKVRDVTPGSIGAYSKGEVDGRVNAKVNKNGDTMTGMLVVPTLNTPIVNYIGERGYTWIKHGSKDSGDAITNNGANLEIGSWQGIGFYDTCDKRYTGTMNLRSGDWRTIGRIIADGGFEGTATNANRLQDWTLQNILDEFLNVWHANRAYAIGDIAYHKNLPSWARLECVVAGTTGNNANIFSKNMKVGQYIIDGGVKWIVDDVRDCNRIGSITGALYLPDGYIKANGATVQRADYPRLVTLADRYNLWTDNTAANAGMFGRGNGSSTFVLPNWIDRMAQFAAQSGATIAAGLPNITGKIDYDHAGNHSYLEKGCLYTDKTPNSTGGISGGETLYRGIHIDASRSHPIYGNSNTVQPAAIRLIPIIRY